MTNEDDELVDLYLKWKEYLSSLSEDELLAWSQVIEQARLAAIGAPPPAPSQPSSTGSGGGSGGGGHHRMGQMDSQRDRSPPAPHHHHGHHMASHQVSSTTGGQFGHHFQSAAGSNMSPTSSGNNNSSAANDFLRNFGGGGAGSSGAGGGSGAANHSQQDLTSNSALLFSTMQGIPSASLGGTANFMTHQQQQQQHQQHQQQHQSFSGLGSSPSQQQQQGQSGNSSGGLNYGAGVSNAGSANSAAAAAAAFANGNPFLLPPPNMTSGLNMPFTGMLPGAGGSNSGGNLGSAATGLNALTQNLGMVTANLSSTTNAINMALSGVHGHLHHQNNANNSNSGDHNLPMNPFANPPPRMNLLNNGLGGGNVTQGQNSMSTHTSSLGGAGGPRMNMMNANYGGGQGGGSMLNPFGAGVGAGTNRPNMNHHNNNMGGPGARNPFAPNIGNNNMRHNNPGCPLHKDNPNRFQLGAIPSGRMNVRDAPVPAPLNRRDRSRSRERIRGGGDLQQNKRRRSRSRDRDRPGAGGPGDRNNRRNNRRSRSRSQSPGRRLGGNKPNRRDSRDKRDPERKSRSDSSPDKSSQDSTTGGRGGRGRTEHEPSPTPNAMNTTTDEWPGAKLTGIPSDASYREIKEFIRAEVMGGSDGVVRLYEEGVAYLKLTNASDFPRVYRSNGRKLRGSPVAIEGITMETWTQEYKLNKSRIERDIDREKEESEREREQLLGRRTEREREHHGRSDRHHNSQHHHNSHTSSTSSSHHHARSSRFSNASSQQSSCIAIRGLAPTITRQELITRYLQETPSQDIVLIAAPTPTNRHSVTAFVQFDSPVIAQAVIDSIVRSPLGTTLVVESCDFDDLQKAKARTSGMGLVAQGPGSAGRASMLGAAAGLLQDTKSIFDLDLGLDDETTTVILKGAPPNISERDVFDFFSDIGLAPMNARILYDNDGQCSGQVICEFQDNNRAKRATTKDGMLFGRGQVSVSLLPSRNRTSGASTAASGDFGAAGAQQQLLFGRNNLTRPGLLGPGPATGGGGVSRGSSGGGGGMTRFSSPNPSGSTPNIFEQALQQQSRPQQNTMESGGTGGGRGGGRRERMSRFSGGNNTNTRNQNGFRGRDRGKGDTGADGQQDSGDLGLFDKKGCVVGLENVPYKASMDDILQYLEETLKITISPDRIIRRYDDFNKPTGDCRVAFDTAFEATLACERLKGTWLWKRPISSSILE